MRISKQSAPYIDSYDLTVTKDELKLIHQALGFFEGEFHYEESGHQEVRKFHSVNFNDRKEQLWEEMSTTDKLKQMKQTIDDIKGILD